MLDEECLRPGEATDTTFLSKLHTICGKHIHFESRQNANFLTDKTLPHNAFRIQHYAGKVTNWDNIFNEKFSLYSLPSYERTKNFLLLKNMCFIYLLFTCAYHKPLPQIFSSLKQTYSHFQRSFAKCLQLAVGVCLLFML